MFGLGGSCLVRATCYLRRVSLNICLDKSGSHFLPRNVSPHVYKNRWFNLSCYLTDKLEFSRDENKVICEYIDSRISVGTNCTNSIDVSTNISGNVSFELDGRNMSNITHQGLLPPSEFLGIETFPDIFDILPPKCTGCGAVLQSQNEYKPGFILKNPNLSRNFEENLFMAEMICARCFSLKHYNRDSMPMVSPQNITNFLSHISRRKALILYVVDVMDIPGSFAEDILKIVGETKHVILACNKIDRLPVDGHPAHQIQHIKKIMFDEAMKFGLQNANIIEVSVISAKTGFGVHDLVKTINKHWRINSDMYIVGCNNSGKTTLFNLLVDLFTASRHSDNMLQRGTVSPSAGTTLGLLRYPITRHRFSRLQDRLKSGYSETKNKENLKEVYLSDEIIDKQMTKYRDVKETAHNSTTAVAPPHGLQFVTRQKNHHREDLSWIYDTPGLYSQNQISHLLTNQELKILNPSLWFVPRTIILRPSKVLFLGGLARLDYLDVRRMSTADPDKEDNVLKASQSIFFTIFASPNLPIHITSLERADELYQQHAGGELLKVPSGGRTRMEEFPEFRSRVFELTGVDWKRSAADVILSNIGWIAVTAGSGSIVTLKAYTPNGAGLYLREPALLPTSVRQRGRRGVPYMGFVNHNMYQGTRKRSPPLVKYFTEENFGATQWMEVAERKRKQQRAVLKFNKTRYQSKSKLGFSARSNPSRYLPDYDGVTKEGQLETEARERHQIEAGTTGSTE